MIKPNLDAFSNRPDLVFVVDRFNYIEQAITKIIANYISAPANREIFVLRYLLNSSIVSFGSKIKLFIHLNATEGWEKVNQNDLHRLAHIRNQFAHSGNQQMQITLYEADSEKNSMNLKLILESVTGSGKLEEVDAEDALQEFTELFVRVKEQMHNVLAKQSNC